MPTRRYEGPSIEVLLEKVRENAGPSAKITNAQKVRRGGLFGFFTRELYSLTVETPSKKAGGGRKAAGSKSAGASKSKASRGIPVSDATAGDLLIVPNKTRSKKGLAGGTGPGGDTSGGIIPLRPTPSEDGPGRITLGGAVNAAVPEGAGPIPSGSPSAKPGGATGAGGVGGTASTSSMPGGVAGVGGSAGSPAGVTGAAGAPEPDPEAVQSATRNWRYFFVPSDEISDLGSGSTGSASTPANSGPAASLADLADQAHDILELSQIVPSTETATFAAVFDKMSEEVAGSEPHEWEIGAGEALVEGGEAGDAKNEASEPDAIIGEPDTAARAEDEAAPGVARAHAPGDIVPELEEILGTAYTAAELPGIAMGAASSEQRTSDEEPVQQLKLIGDGADQGASTDKEVGIEHELTGAGLAAASEAAVADEVAVAESVTSSDDVDDELGFIGETPSLPPDIVSALTTRSTAHSRSSQANGNGSHLPERMPSLELELPADVILPRVPEGLARIGFPASLMPPAESGSALPVPFDPDENPDGPEASRRVFLEALQALPPAPPIPDQAGMILAIAGDISHARRLASKIALERGLDPREIFIASPEFEFDLADTPRVPAWLTITSATVALEKRARWTSRPHSTIVIVDAPINGKNREWARKILECLEPDVVCGIVEATHKPEDIATWASSLGKMDCLAIESSEITCTPATVLASGIPVALIDGEEATSELWDRIITGRLSRC